MQPTISLSTARQVADLAKNIETTLRREDAVKPKGLRTPTFAIQTWHFALRLKADLLHRPELVIEGVPAERQQAAREKLVRLLTTILDATLPYIAR